MAASVVSCPPCKTRNRVPVVASGQPILLDGGTIVDQMIGALPAPAMRNWVTSALARRG